MRKKGCRRLIIDGKPVDISADVDLDEIEGRDDMDAVVDRFVVGRKHEKAIKAGIASHAARRRRTDAGSHRQRREQGGSRALLRRPRAARRTTSSTETSAPSYFVFNNPESACRTCGGLGVDKLTHPELLVPDPDRSIRGGCFVREAFRYNPDTWDGRMMFSLAKALDFSLDTPWKELSEVGASAILYGIDTEKIRSDVAARSEGETRRPGRQGDRFRRNRATHRAPLSPLSSARRSEFRYGGVARQSDGRTHVPRLQWRAPSRDAAAVHDQRARTIHEIGQLNFDELHAFLGTIKPTGRGADAGRQVLKEIRGRLELLLGIGLDYLNFNRRSGTLSGGESQRIRLSTQIGSGLMGMLYVLDEPSIGLHPKDNVKMIATLESLRDIGNTVIVVEHDEDTIRAADHIVEMGPGPGVHGGTVVVQGDDRRCARVQSVADRAVPVWQALDRDAEASGGKATARHSTCAGRAKTT